MREAMAKAEVGDDVYGEDPTVNLLEKTAAEIMGKEAGLYVPTGTMGNLLAIITHCGRGQEVIMGAESHTFVYEVGGATVVGGVIYHTVQENKMGQLSPEQVSQAIRGDNIHYPTTGLLSLENTHNRAGGTVMSIELTKSLCNVAHAQNIPTHLDGARVFNAATYLERNVKELVAEFDSVQFCLSKGLGAPLGSLLVGKRNFIDKARKHRKMLGGGMRQAGVVAAAGMLALTEMPKRLSEDHQNARRFAESLALVPGLDLDLETVQTNMVFVDTTASGHRGAEWAEKLKEQGVLINAVGPNRLRFVTHYDVDRSDLDAALSIIARLF
jgi:threonine aldolase